MGLSPQQFLINLRMEQTKEYLTDTEKNIQEITRMVGYNDEFVFSKAFKRYSGFSPKLYRQNIHNNSK
jgi:AraC-like DNA-binding protein